MASSELAPLSSEEQRRAYAKYYQKPVLPDPAHRTRFWMGYRMSGGKPELVLPPGIAVPAVAIQGLARHNVWEFSNLRVLLPQIFSELGGRMIE